MSQKRVVLIFLILSISSNFYAQTIAGRVLDKATKEPLVNANVYFNGTFTGTMTDNLGKFELNASKHPNQTLVISSLGYYSESLFEYSFDEIITIELAPKTIEIGEIRVVYNKTEADKLRKLGIKRFKKEFLGNTYNARKCDIQNLDDIKFKFSQDRNSFEAFADKPIVIYNEALGYKITYHLDFFRKNKEEVFYKGNYLFVEDTIGKKRKTKRTLELGKQLI